MNNMVNPVNENVLATQPTYSQGNAAVADVDFDQTLAQVEPVSSRQQASDDSRSNHEGGERIQETVNDRGDSAENVNENSVDDDGAVDTTDASDDRSSHDDSTQSDASDHSEGQGDENAEQTAEGGDTTEVTDTESSGDEAGMLAALEAQIDPNALAALMMTVQEASQGQTQGAVETSAAGSGNTHTGQATQAAQQNLASQTMTGVQTQNVQAVEAATQTQAETTGGETSGQASADAGNTEIANTQTATTSTTTTQTTTTTTTATQVVENVAAPAPAANVTGGGDGAQQVNAAANALQDVQNADANVARVMRGVQGVINQNGGSVTLRLHPPEMGVVRIEMSVENNTVRAQFQAEHESVRNLLTHRIATLQRALENQGMNVERISVTTTQQTQNDLLQDQSSEAFAEEGRSRGFFNQQAEQDENPDDTGSEQQQQQTTRFEQQLNAVG